MKAALDSQLPSSSKAYDGNKVQLLINGVQSYKQRKENIEDADVVLLKTYNFRTDESGQKMLSWLIERAKKGKLVVVQFDAKGFGGRATIRFVANRPDKGLSGQYIEKLICLMLKGAPAKSLKTGAPRTVALSNAFFLPSDGLLANGIDAMRRGLMFKLLVNGTRNTVETAFSTVAKTARCAFRAVLAQIPDLAQTNADVWEWDPQNPLVESAKVTRGCVANHTGFRPAL